MEFKTNGDAAPTEVRVSGEIDMADADDVYSAVTEAARRGDGVLVLDLSEVTFMDSTGLGVLVRLRDELPKLYASRLVLRSPSPAVRKVLELTSLIDLFPITSTQP